MANGKHFREEISANYLREAAALIGATLTRSAASWRSFPQLRRLPPRRLKRSCSKSGVTAFSIVYVSVADDLLLVSEDIHYRAIARELHGREGAWLHAILMVAVEAGMLDRGSYAEAVYGLSANKHNHVGIERADAGPDRPARSV